MNMKLAVVLGTVCAAAMLTLSAGEHPQAKTSAEKAMTQSVQVCPHCETLALKAGNCVKCGKEMVPKHLLGTKDGQAMICDCAADCKCDAKGMKDGKCACGKAVKTMKATGLYSCPDGCAKLSAEPGKCACGKELKLSK